MQTFSEIFDLSEDDLMRYLNGLKETAVLDPFRQLRYEREFTPYGLCINGTSNAHYLFNRDYLILPFQMPRLLLHGALAVAMHRRLGVDGHGRYRPVIKDPSEWMTGYFFNDGSAPQWRKKTYHYDQTKYQ
jgi:hypothetical protein